MMVLVLCLPCLYSLFLKNLTDVSVTLLLNCWFCCLKLNVMDLVKDSRCLRAEVVDSVLYMGVSQ